MPGPDTLPDDLFGAPEPVAPREPETNRPLADRLRPTTLSEIVGQDHLLGPEGSLIRMLERGSLASLILWGPPGVGKTTIARLLAARAKLAFVQLSAVFSGVADLKRAFDDATKRRRAGQGTLLFVDEIHRFNFSHIGDFWKNRWHEFWSWCRNVQLSRLPVTTIAGPGWHCGLRARP